MVGKARPKFTDILKGVAEDFIMGVWHGMGTSPQKPKRSKRGKAKKKV